MKRKRNLKVGDGFSPSAVRERWTRRAACMAGLAAMAGSARRHARGASGRGTPGLGGGYHRRCSSSAQFRLTRFSVFPFSLAAIRDGRVVRDTTGAEGQLPRTGLYRPIFTHFVAEARRVVQGHASPFCTMKLRTARGFRAGHRATSRRGFLGAFR